MHYYKRMATPQKSNSSGSKGANRWKPTSTIEARRLGYTEDDWNLAGGAANLPRTRGRRLIVTHPPVPQQEAVCSPCGNNDDTNTDVSSLTDDNSTTTPSSSQRKRPPHSRVIIEVREVTKMLESHLKCPHCNGHLALTFPTVCLASSCRLECKNKIECTYTVNAKPALAKTIPLADDAGSVLITRDTDFATNVLYVLGFIASGDGGTEAARLLGLLGLPNSTTMQSSSFGTIEKGISPVIQEFADEIVMENLRKEVALIFGDAMDEDNNNKLYDLWLEKKLPEHLWPRLDGCADMGWQQKGSGRRRNSKSGHAFVVGMLTRKIIAKSLCSKSCGFCKSWHTRHPADEEEPPQHECFINHDGSSGSMEPKAVLDMYKWLYEQHVIIKRFVADDDSSIKAKMKWSNADHMLNHNTTTAPKIVNSKGNVVTRPDHGSIPRHMPEPEFVADPNHRRKTLAGVLYALSALGKTPPEQQKPTKDGRTKPWNMTMTRMDCRRLSKNFAFMARTLKHKKTDAEILDAGKAVLEHHFDNHQYCGGWCHRKQQQQEELLRGNSNDEDKDDDDDAAAPPKKKKKKKQYYRDKTKDAKLYAKLQSLMRRFLTLEALQEVAHNMDTCANESFNNTISWLAPKNKVYSGTCSLQNRISIAIGISTLGTLAFFHRLFDKMGIQMTPDVHHYLRVVGNNRKKRLDKTKTKAYKNKRKAHEFERLKKETVEATIARDKRDGTYKSGIGMTGGYDEEAAEDDGAKKPAAAVAAVGLKKCTSCGGTDHQRTTSRRCKNYVPRQNNKKQKTKQADEDGVTDGGASTAEAEAKAMADELDRLESLPIEDDDSSAFFSAASEFS